MARRAKGHEVSRSGIVTLLTDFGVADPFVGILHGVMLTSNPDVRVVDLGHGVAPRDVGQASFWLLRSFRYFPRGTVHVAVVDPGVGTSRGAVVVEAAGHLFVAPDNGLLSPIAAAAGYHRAYRLDPARLKLSLDSRTFHGRDLFAPVGALLAGGLDARECGDEQGVLAPSVLSDVTIEGRCAVGEVIVVDRFGNLISNVGAEGVAAQSGARALVGGREVGLTGTYAEVPSGEPTCVVSSFGTFECAVRNGNASQTLGVGRGARFEVVW